MIDVTLSKIREGWRQILPTITTEAKKRVNGETSYICPLCGHGSHGDGLTMNPKGKPGALICFGCGFSGDVIDLYGKAKGLSFKDAVQELAKGDYKPIPSKQQKPKHQEQDFSGFYEKAKLLLPEKFPNGYRGASLATLQRCGVGYCQEWRSPGVSDSVPSSPRIIFPSGRCSYMAENPTIKTGDYRKMFVGERRPFNFAATQQKRPCFVVEGEMDALSLLEVGADAVSIGGTSGVNKFVELCKASPPSCELLLALDNDDAGRNATKTLQKELEKGHFSYRLIDVGGLYGGLKDANEALLENRENFRKRATVYTTNGVVVVREDPWAATLDGFLERIKNETYKPIPTGIPEIDYHLGGGFMRKQLIVLGAAPGVGKTAFCQWVMESMAAKNEDFSCMYTCFEMSKDQLIARSLSRKLNTLSPWDILKGRDYQNTRAAAMDYHGAIGRHICYNPFCNENELPSPNLTAVMNHAERGAEIRTPAPFLVVDYLQLLSVDGKDEQEALKAATMVLKKFAVRWNTVVIAVIAQNRQANIQGKASLFSGRGSSSIEYSADSVLSLTYRDDETDHQGEPDRSKLRLTFVKNRFGKAGATIDIDFDGEHMQFSALPGIELTRRQGKNIDWSKIEAR